MLRDRRRGSPWRPVHSCTVVLWGLHDSDAHSWYVTREGQFGPEWPEALGPDRVPVVKGLDTAPRASSLPSSSWWERHCPYVPATAGQTLSVLGTQLARPHVPVHTPAATTARQEDPWPSRNCLRPQGSLSAPPFVTAVPCRAVMADACVRSCVCGCRRCSGPPGGPPRGKEKTKPELANRAVR